MINILLNILITLIVSLLTIVLIILAENKREIWDIIASDEDDTRPCKV